jgi:hypothetical protein
MIAHGNPQLRGHLSMGLIAATMLFAFATACEGGNTIWTPNGETEFVGKAIDRATGQPIAGVWVLGIYRRGRSSLLGDSDQRIGLVDDRAFGLRLTRRAESMRPGES